MRVYGFTTTRPNGPDRIGSVKFCELLEVLFDSLG